MQKIQSTKRYYKMYKKGRFWVVAGITVMAAGISPMVVHADTATTAITAEADATGKQASPTPAPTSAEAQSVAPASTEQTGSAASSSAGTDSSANSAASSASAPTSVSSEAGSQTAGSGAVTSAAGSEAAPASANEAGSGVPANSTAPSSVDNGTPSSAASTALSNESAASASNAPETISSAAATESTASKSKLMAKRALRAPAAMVASVDPDEQDLSDQFTDANLLAAVRRGFSLADGASLTMNTIKTYKSSHFEVKAYTVTNGEIEYYPVTNLQGLQVLANLPAETTTAVDIQLGGDGNNIRNFDFSPLKSIKIWNLNLYTYYWSIIPDDQLQLIAGLDTSTIHNLEFASPNKLAKNPYGMTNHQFNILAPFVKAVLENHFPGSQMIGFSGNNITDFSALKSVSPTQSSQVTGLFEWDFRTNKLACSAGDTVEVESALTGVQGESVNYTVRYYQDNGTAEGELVAADAHEETVTNLDGTTHTVWKYTLVNPLIVDNVIRYGMYYYEDGLWAKYKTDINGNPLSDFGSALGVHTIQPVTSSKATLTFNPSEVVMGPNATWNYLDHIASATDYDGNPISQDKWNTLSITNVNGLPDLTKAGWQTVEFTFTDDLLTATADVHVLASQAGIMAKADQIVWPKEVSDIKSSDLVASVTDAYGNPVTDFTTVQMSALDAAKAGAQLVTLTYTDEAGNQVTATLNVTVDLATVATQPVKVVVGPTAKWKYEMNLLGVTDSLGQPLAVDKATIKVVTGPDLTVAKPQTVILEYTDDLGRTQRFEALVTTIQSQAAITANDDLIVWPKEVGGLTVAELVRNVTDMNGNAVTDLTNVTMSGIDPAKSGAQPITLTYTDAVGNQVTATLNVTVDLASLTTKDVQLVAGPTAKWDYVTNLTGATDSLGQAIDVKTANVKVITGPDLTVAKPQTVILEYTDDLGRTQRFEALVTTISSQAAITANDDLIVWPKEVGELTVAELVRNVTDMNGNAVTDLANVTMSDVDPAKSGSQPITLSYTDAAGNQVTATINVTVDLATLTTKDIQLVAGPTATWDYLTHLVSVKDSFGQAIDAKTANVKVITGPDLTVAQPQKVILEYTDDLGRTQRFEALVTTIQSQAAITANDDLIVWPKEVGGLTVAELVRNVTDMNGNAVTDLTNVTMSGIDPAKSGAQTITLTYTDAVGNQVTATLNVTVDLATLTTKDVQLVAGPTAKWDYKANLESVLDSRGQSIDAATAKVKVVTGPDLSDAKVGVPQTVVLEYTDDLGRTQQFNATVTTTKTQATITAKDDPIVWPAEVADLTVTDLVHSVTDANGQAVPDLTGVTMSKVDPAKAGVQPITLTYTDAAGNQVTTTINVTVDLASLTTKDVQLVAGPTAKWDYMTNLTGATDSLGQAVDVKTANVKVITGPDLSAALVGQPQTVVLEYTDDLGRTQRFNAVVTTTATQASITAKADQVVWPGDVKNLTAADLVHNVIDADGQTVTDLSNVTMSGVDATKAGVQTVTLIYTDAAGNRVTTTINVTVDLATLTTKDVQVVAGPTAKWDYLTSLTGATDSLGQVLDVKNAHVQVVTAPDLSTALVGQPQTVTFEYTDNLGQTQRVSALVTTMKTQAAIAGKDVTVVAGPNAKWTLTDSLDGSQSFAADGSALSATDLAAVTTNSTPNVQKPGTYVLTLSYVDAAGNLVTGTANVNVVASQAALQVQDSQIKVGANWQAADNLLRVVDSAGQPASIEQVTVTGTVDTTKAGIYPVTYKYTDAAGNVLERTANVTVVAEPTDPGNGGGTTDPGNGGVTTDSGNGGTTDPGNGGGTTDPGNGGGMAAPDNGDTISTQPGPATPELVADPSPVATPQPTVKKTTIQADQVRPATAAFRSVVAAKTPQSSSLPQTDERRTGMTAMVAGLLGLTGLFSAWGATKRRQRK